MVENYETALPLAAVADQFFRNMFPSLLGKMLNHIVRNRMKIFRIVSAKAYLHSRVVGSDLNEPFFVDSEETSGDGWRREAPGRVSHPARDVLGWQVFPEEVQVPVETA